MCCRHSGSRSDKASKAGRHIAADSSESGKTGITGSANARAADNTYAPADNSSKTYEQQTLELQTLEQHKQNKQDTTKETKATYNSSRNNS